MLDNDDLKVENKDGTVALIDGDILAHFCCKNRFIKKDGTKIVKGEDHTFTMGEDAAYFEECWVNFKDILNNLIEQCFASSYLMAIKGENNFRDAIYPEYKANRKKENVITNPFVPLLRQQAIDEGLAIPAHGVEADDLLRIWKLDHDARGIETVICSIDKDLKMISGNHYNIKSKKHSVVLEEDATRFSYEQYLKGDPTDNIKGIVGIGEIKARELLREAKTEEEYQSIVMREYQIGYGENWEKELILNGRLLYLLKHPEDCFAIDKWQCVIDFFNGDGIIAAAPEKTYKTKVGKILEVAELPAFVPLPVTPAPVFKKKNV